MVDKALESESRGQRLSLFPSLPARFWEAVPGIVSWLILLSPFWVTLIAPVVGPAVVLFLIGAFLTNIGIYGVGALFNRGHILRGLQTDWLARLDDYPRWRDVRVIVMVRAFREGNKQMLRDMLDSLYACAWDKSDGRLRNVELVFSTEVDDPITPPIVAELAEEYAGKLKIREIAHPVEPWVVPGPSSSMHYAGRVVSQEIRAAGEDPRRVLVADIDADTLFHPTYLSCLMYHFVSDPHALCRLYQPVVLFTTAYWAAPLHSRQAALGSTILTIGWNRFPEIAFTGAAGAASLYESVDWWPTQSHSQDSGVEMRLRLKYGDKFDVTGLPTTTSVYPVMMQEKADASWPERLKARGRSLRVLFRQSARWREGPLDEFIEASLLRRPFFMVQKLWNGVERDTLTLLSLYGATVVRLLCDWLYPRYNLGYLSLISTAVFSAATVVALAVAWRTIVTHEFIPGAAGWRRRFVELLLWWLVAGLYLPLMMGLAGLKTSTAYALGKKPRGHYIPTPK